MVVTHADPPADLPYKERPLHIYFFFKFYLSFSMYLCKELHCAYDVHGILH